MMKIPVPDPYLIRPEILGPDKEHCRSRGPEGPLDFWSHKFLGRTQRFLDSIKKVCVVFALKLILQKPLICSPISCYIVMLQTLIKCHMLAISRHVIHRGADRLKNIK